MLFGFQEKKEKRLVPSTQEVIRVDGKLVCSFCLGSDKGEYLTREGMEQEYAKGGYKDLCCSRCGRVL